jgi:hypothetical protein
MKRVRFEDADFSDGLLAPGAYRASVRSAKLRQSKQGNWMVEVICELAETGGKERVTDYFVLEGASSRGLAVARCRLVELYRACGLDPQSGDEIHPEELAGAEIEVKVGHQERDGEIRLRVVGYRAVPRSLDDDLPF